jgi:hypothetical protein
MRVTLLVCLLLKKPLILTKFLFHNLDLADWKFSVTIKTNTTTTTSPGGQKVHMEPVVSIAVQKR